MIILPSFSVTSPVATTLLPANSMSFSFLFSVQAPTTSKMPLSLATASGAPFFAHAAAQSAWSALVALAVPCLVLHCMSTSTPVTVLVSADRPDPNASVTAATPSINLRMSLSLIDR